MNFKRLIFCIVIILGVIVLFLPGYTNLNDLKAKNKQLEEKIEKLKKENIALKKEKQLLSEDITYIEKVARKRLGVVKKGEKIYKVGKR